MKFTAIEGLRGWLAWAVVFSHLAYSGFVITRVLRLKARISKIATRTGVLLVDLAAYVLAVVVLIALLGAPR